MGWAARPQWRESDPCFAGDAPPRSQRHSQVSVYSWQGRWCGHTLERRHTLQRDAAAGQPEHRAQDRRAARDDDAEREAAADAAARRTGRSPTPTRRPAWAAVFSLTDPAKINHFQHIAVEQSRLHIPILFAYDTIHGYRTIFPIPLGAASSFDPSVATADDTIARARDGDRRHQADLQPDGRRLARAALGPHLRGRRRGPVPRLRLRRRPRQGGPGPRLLARPTRSSRASSTSPPTASPRAAASTTPPTCRSSGCATSTCRRSRPRSTPAPTPRCARSTPSTACPAAPTTRLETDILKGEWGFDGFIESDYTAVAELRACPPKTPDNGPCGHGVAADGPDAAAAALNAGTDSEMVSHQHPRLRQAAARRSAGSRWRASTTPCAGSCASSSAPGSSTTPTSTRPRPSAPSSFVTAADRAAARTAAGKSMVLLKNDGPMLPLDPAKTTVGDRPAGRRPARHARPVVGPGQGRGRRLAARRHHGAGPEHDVHARAARSPTRIRRTTRPRTSAARTPASRPRSPRPSAADQVVLALGESRGQSGEAASRSDIDLPGKQQELIDAIKADRQAVRRRAVQRPPADARRRSPRRRRRSSRPGSRASRPATPSPTCCSARSTPAASCRSRSRAALGQIPIYYNHEPTGPPVRRDVEVQLALPRPRRVRPAVRVRLRAELHDVLGHEPAPQRARACRRTARSRRRSTSTTPARVAGDDVVQLYIHDPVASISQPVRRLRGFQRVTLAPGARADRQLHARQERLRLLRQPRQVRRRAGRDRRVRRRQLERRPDAVVHGERLIHVTSPACAVRLA